MNTMNERTRLLWQLALLFIVAAFLLFLMDWQMLAGPSELDQRPFAALSLAVMAGLFAAAGYLVSGRVEQLTGDRDRLQQQLNAISSELEATRSNLEQRVERRTFEISVANASLNREIAERIQAEAETKRVTRRMELILQSAGDGIFGLDVEGNVTFVNKAATLMLGWSSEELTGKSHHGIIHHTRVDGTPYPVSECPIHHAYQDGKVHFGSDEVFWNRNGQSFPVEYISTPIIEGRRPTGAVVVFRELGSCRKSLPPGGQS